MPSRSCKGVTDVRPVTSFFYDYCSTTYAAAERYGIEFATGDEREDKGLQGG